MRWLFAFFLPFSNYSNWLRAVFISCLAFAVFFFTPTLVGAQKAELPNTSTRGFFGQSGMENQGADI